MSRASLPTAENDSALQALSVAELTAQIKGSLEAQFPSVWVTGEVSNLSRPQSGHCYFTLKDDAAQIRAVVWRGSASRMKFDLRDGLELVCRGRIDVYGPRGSYQLVIDQAMPKGVGALELALRELKAKLQREGLFDADRKRPLPRFPRRIGFVTSATGAAVRDFLQVLARRWRGVDVLVIPTRVQGDGAAEEIAEAIRLANQVQPPLDTLVVGRGGGSLEDLWAFNDEPVVRALAASAVPTISAVGHEIDFTLADFAADVRALTPSEAAERVVPSADELTSRVASIADRMSRATWRALRTRRDRLAAVEVRRPVARPHALLEDRARRVDELEQQATRGVRRRIETARGRIATLTAQIDSLSPLGVLARGYSLTTAADTGRVVRDADAVRVGERIKTRLSAGAVLSRVESIEPNETPAD
ncbi:MAG: exodeoxyribonuclease VII large subunit [Planctomycetota bacterium]